MIQNIIIALAIVSLVANSHTYCARQVGCFRYDCQDYTKDAILLLRHEGYEAYPAVGIQTGIGPHVWVLVKINGTTYHIEPQTASVVVPSIRGCIDCDRGPYEFSHIGVARGLV